MGLNSYSENTYPKRLLKYFSEMDIGESVERDELIKEIWCSNPDWFKRRSFDVAKATALKGTQLKVQMRKGILTRLE